MGDDVLPPSPIVQSYLRSAKRFSHQSLAWKTPVRTRSSRAGRIFENARNTPSMMMLTDIRKRQIGMRVIGAWGEI
jgi:hypothetical protein